MPVENPPKVAPSWYQNPLLKPALPFLVGGTSGIVATICIQPIDMIKVRIQLSEGAATPVTVLRQVVSQGRILDLYSGLSAGILRQVVYGTARLGLFFTFEDMLKQRASRNGTTYGFSQRASAGIAAGALGATIGNPAEVALIRMQSDGLLPASQRANYRSVFHALSSITRNEGVKGLWSGAYPTIIRAMAVNFGQLAFFSESKHQLTQRTALSEQTKTVAASCIAGFFAAFFSLPFDFMKSRLQSQRKSADGAVRYKGMLDCFVKVAKDEGLLSFYRGFGTYFMRLAPHTVIALIVADNLNMRLR
ncbi:putative mitochondrial 2-oxoglutarate/malate carrier protein [Lachnellula occidentalis]|uniref:Putative mitochondrial 2-oxoglutarate/malate carrier protein n=1 Tax=Lachnellula occidentalis TaxID=215460 RepID=A0A8H8S3L5_9HELO|nr:putative mitochondrial 2-oxoglutarate/malate carrier protein [Lachnellula occidentalis]